LAIPAQMPAAQMMMRLPVGDMGRFSKIQLAIRMKIVGMPGMEPISL
jgi:hypothetical protein